MEQNQDQQPNPPPPVPAIRPRPPDLLVISTRDLHKECMRQFALEQTAKQVLYRLHGVGPPRAPFHVPRPNGPPQSPQSQSTRDQQNEGMRQFALQQTSRQILNRLHGVGPPRALFHVPRPDEPPPQ